MLALFGHCFRKNKNLLIVSRSFCPQQIGHSIRNNNKTDNFMCIDHILVPKEDAEDSYHAL